MAEIDFDRLLNFFKVLSNESRLKLLGILSQTECSVEDLAARLQLKEPTVSHHLNKLKELDLVMMRSLLLLFSILSLELLLSSST